MTQYSIHSIYDSTIYVLITHKNAGIYTEEILTKTNVFDTLSLFVTILFTIFVLIRAQKPNENYFFEKNVEATWFWRYSEFLF